MDDAEPVTREDYLAAWEATLLEVREQIEQERRQAEESSAYRT